MQSNAPVDTIFHQIHTREQPPTFFKTDKIIAGFQGVVDAYAVARYREVIFFED